MVSKKFITENECDALVEAYMGKHPNLAMTKSELVGHYLDKVLNDEEINANSNMVNVDFYKFDRDSQVRSALENGKNVLISVFAEIGDTKTIEQLREFRDDFKNDVTYSDIDITTDLAFHEPSQKSIVNLYMIKRG